MDMIVLGSCSTLVGKCSEVVEVTVAADRAMGVEPRYHDFPHVVLPVKMRNGNCGGCPKEDRA